MFMPMQKGKPLLIMLGLTSCAFVLNKIYKKYKLHTTKVSPALGDDKNAISQLSAPFQRASELATSLSLDQDDQLMVYGLYKQANSGNASNTTEPSRLNFVSFKKYSSWKKFHNMPRHFAMMKYIEIVEHFIELGKSDTDPGGAGKVCIGGGNDAVEEMMDQNDIDYGEESSVDLSEDSDEINEDRDEFKKLPAEISLGAKQSTLGGGSTPQQHEEDMNFMQAAGIGDAILLEQFIHSDSDVNEKDDSGQSALHMAADTGSIKCVQILLEAGADPNASDNDGISVLEAAVIGGSIEVVTILVNAGADPDHQDVDGDTPRSCAEDDDNEDMKMLLRGAQCVKAVEQ
jgi:ankyrin repeat protein